MSSPLLYALLRKSIVKTLIQVRSILIFQAWPFDASNRSRVPPCSPPCSPQHSKESFLPLACIVSEEQKTLEITCIMSTIVSSTKTWKFSLKQQTNTVFSGRLPAGNLLILTQNVSGAGNNGSVGNLLIFTIIFAAPHYSAKRFVQDCYFHHLLSKRLTTH